MKLLRKALRVLAWLALLALLLGMWIARDPHATTDPAGKDWVLFKDLLYRSGPGEDRRLDLYLPGNGDRIQSAATPVPVVLAIHGGSWTGGSKSDYGPQVARLTKYGYAVAVPDYRLARPGVPSWPGVMDDLREAVRWLRRHAADYSLDPRRVVALGSGAGGHLAALLGAESPAQDPDAVPGGVQAVIDLYGPTDLLPLLAGRNLEHDPVRRLVGRSDPEALDDASPVHHVSARCSPMLIIHGLDDLWVPPDQSRVLRDRLAKAGVRHRLLLVPGAQHGFELELLAPSRRDLVPEILAFLETVWQAHLRNEP
jgi:acetyl esterase/lipase